MFVRNKSIVKTFYFHESIIHNNASCSEKVSPVVLSHQNLQKYLFRTILVLDLCIFLSWFRRDNFFTEGSVIMDYRLFWSVFMMDLFLTNTQLFASQDVNWWTGVMDYLWIIVMFLSAVWTLILTAPIHCRGSLVSKWCNATFFQKKQTHVLFGWPEGE